MKIKITLIIGMLSICLNAFSQFFDSVPYIGAFNVNGGNRGTVNSFKGYDPDPSNTDADWTKPWANFAPNSVIYPGDAAYTGPSSNSQFYTLGRAQDKVVISADISSDYHMTNDKFYELSGLIHVLSGATLTIDPGTCIRGSLTNLGGLIITQGAKIIAVSDRNHPVVITSGKAANTRVRGDWAGLLILGYASCNYPGGQRRFEALPSDPLAMYGGVPANDADNSGSIRYMRVEFAGYNYLPDQEINGITFGAVGSGSHFDYMQSSFANDDGFEWFGGTCNHKYLIGFSETDDEFDMDEGYRGKCQYLLGLRNAGLTETSPGGACNGLEHDNNTNLGTPAAVNPNITAPTPTTAPTISNMTLVGPEHPGAVKSSLSTLWQQRTGEAFRLRTNDATGVFNSITWGYPTMINLPNVANLSPSVQTRASDDELCIRNTVIITSNGDVRFNSSNYPTGTGAWPTGASVWSGLGDMRNWLINGPAISVYGANWANVPTKNDTTRSTILDLGSSSSDITHPDYSGVSNGSLSQLDYTVCDFTLTANSAFKSASSFQHPRIAIVATPSIAVNPTTLGGFSQVIGTPSATKLIIIKTANLNAGSIVTIKVPAGFEVSANGTSWATTFTKGTTAADTNIYIRLNRTYAGTTTGVLTISSSNATDFSTVNIIVNGTAIAPATPFINISANNFSFNNAVGSPTMASFLVSGKNLTANVSVKASSNFEVSTSASNGFGSTISLAPTSGTLAFITLYVRYNPSASGNHMGNLSIASANTDTLNVTLTGNSLPIINVLPGNVFLGGAFQLQYPVINAIAGVPSLAYPIMISGSLLTDTVKMNVPTNFEMSVDSAFTSPVLSSATLYLNTAKAATLNQKIYIRYNAATATTNAGNLTVISTGAPLTYSGNSTTVTGPASQLVSLSGRSVATGTKFVSLISSSYQLKYSSVLGVATAPQAIAVSGYNLGTDSLVVTAPANWEISLNGINYTSVITLPNTAGMVTPTPILVRYNPSVPFALNQFVIVSLSSASALPNTNSATNLVVLVYGIATPAISVDNSNLPTFFTTAGKASNTNTFNIGGMSLQDTVWVNATNGFQISLDSVNFSTKLFVKQSSGTIASTKLYVRFMSATAGSVNGNYIQISTLNGASIPVYVSAVNVIPPTPVITLSTGSLSFLTNVLGPTSPKSFTVDALNLTDSVSLTVGSSFQLSADSMNYSAAIKFAGTSNGTVSARKVFVRFNRTTAGTSSDTVYVLNTGATTQKIALNGTNTTGLQSVSNSIRTFVMYPNPAQHELNIDLTLTKNSEVTVSIFDVTGKLVKEIPAQKVDLGITTISFPIEELNNGLYFVRVSTADEVRTSRLMISRN